MQQQQDPGGYHVVQKGMSAIDIWHIWQILGGKACSNKQRNNSQHLCNTGFRGQAQGEEWRLVDARTGGPMLGGGQQTMKEANNQHGTISDSIIRITHAPEYGRQRKPDNRVALGPC